MSSKDINGKILTACIAPPIPTRAFDYAAWIDGYEESGPQGHGETRELAIQNLEEQLAEMEASEDDSNDIG